jgi:hypothetical protein
MSNLRTETGFSKHQRRLRFCLLLVGLLCLASTAGCDRRTKLNTEYGKINGSKGSDSLNGVSILAKMFEERGLKVKRRTRISPRINRYDTIVWFPDDYSCPSEEAVEALNTWLDDDSRRTLIYVGRDYDAQTDYMNAVKASAPVEEKEELLRQIAEGKYAQDDNDAGGMFPWFDQDLTTCEWFEQEKVQRRKAETVTNYRDPTSKESELANVELSTVLVPNLDGDWNAREWLDADGNDFATILTNDTHVFDGKIYVISNGSTLLNYSLINPDHRELATELIDDCNAYSDVVFLESGPRGIEVSDSDTINHNSWAWISQPPLRYIVPHFLLWGILFCFVYFPIFGRPKRIRRKSTSSFRSHVNAMGKLLARNANQQAAINKIQNYQNLISGDSNRKPKED